MTPSPGAAWREVRQGRWHRPALLAFLALACAHMAEHVLQMAQIHLLGLPPPRALGLLGAAWPALVEREALHFGYALLTLLGLLLLRPGLRGAAGLAWDVALAFSVFHATEHVLLLGQHLAGANLFGAAGPTTLLQLAVPRPDLHMTYNVLVFVPLLAGALPHLPRPPAAPEAHAAPPDQAAPE